MKFKEIFKKIKNKKYCLTALLLAGLLIFAVLGSLNGSKSGKNQAYAATAPAVKNLDLNGVRYNYNFSLFELKNNYGLFKDSATTTLFTMVNTSESLTSISYQNIINATSINDIDNLTDLANATSWGFSFKDKNNNVLSVLPSVDTTETNGIYVNLDLNSFNNIKSLSIDFYELGKLPKYNSDLNIENCYMEIYFYYLPNDFSDFTNFSEIQEKSIIVGYSFSRLINYEFILEQYSTHSLRNIICNISTERTFGNTEILSINTQQFNTAGIFSSLSDTINTETAIENVNFVDNNETNIIKYNAKSATYTPYMGYILLSNKDFDYLLNNYINTTSIPARVVTQFFDSPVYFGGNFNNSIPISSITFHNTIIGDSGMFVSRDGDYPSPFKENGIFEILYNPNINFRKVNYYNQNQLIYVEKMQSLQISESGGYSGTGLSAQVADILYNVNYVGEIEEIEFNEKVEEDFTNLIKTAGLGGFLGLLLGLLFGIPGIGAGIGALIGLGVGIIPLIIDGLQAIFGKDFLRGLYDFFKSITEFFANFVDTVINFLMSIITNPFVLVFIVIAAIIFLIFYFRNK